MLWTGWVAYFAVVEYLALRSDEEGSTLSQVMREILGVGSGTAHQYLGLTTLCLGMAWLVHHLHQG